MSEPTYETTSGFTHPVDGHNATVDIDEKNGTIIVQPYGNSTLVNGICRSDDQRVGNISIIERDGEQMIKVNYTPT